jgi:hypothetical protein
MSTWQWPPGWRSLRAATFARYGDACYFPGCPRFAGTVDHIVLAALAGGHDLGNLRPACSHHNSSTGASMGNRMRPLTGAQRRAIAARAAGRQVRGPWPQSRSW